MLIDQSLSCNFSSGEFQQIVLGDLVVLLKGFASKSMNTGITSMVLGTEGDDWSITALPGSTDVMNDSRASFSVSKVNAKDAPEACKFVKMFFLCFSRHTCTRKPTGKIAFQRYCLTAKKYRLGNYPCNP